MTNVFNDLIILPNFVSGAEEVLTSCVVIDLLERRNLSGVAWAATHIAKSAVTPA